MKKGNIKGTWGSTFKKVAIATFALAVLFMFNVTAVYADDIGAAAQEQVRGRIRTEREERTLLPNSIRENRNEREQDNRGRRNRTEREERIFLPSGIREIRGEREEMLCIRERMTELEFERSGNRTRSDRESRRIFNGLFRVS